MQKRNIEDLNRMDVPDYRQSEKMPVICVLDNIRSQHNIGSMFRTSDAFRVQCLYLCGITATPPNREISKTALGATESVSWKYYENTADAALELKKDGYTLLAVEQAKGSIYIQDFIPQQGQKLALIFGNEVNGVSDEVMNLVDQSIEIPQFGTKHSFNVSVTFGILVYHICVNMGNNVSK
jgi:23S rRNA (guanosine2251-2'-O)-methyltransferase